MLNNQASTVLVVEDKKSSYLDELINNYSECSNFENSDIKCLYCNEESLILQKCIECNTQLGYYPLNYQDKDEKYKQCYNEMTKLDNFYFDLNSNSYKLCYELCHTCNSNGN